MSFVAVVVVIRVHAEFDKQLKYNSRIEWREKWVLFLVCRAYFGLNRTDSANKFPFELVSTRFVCSEG